MTSEAGKPITLSVEQKIVNDSDDDNLGTEIRKLDIDCRFFNYHKLKVSGASKLRALTLVDNLSSIQLWKGKVNHEKAIMKKQKNEDQKTHDDDGSDSSSGAGCDSSSQRQPFGSTFESPFDEENPNGCFIM